MYLAIEYHPFPSKPKFLQLLFEMDGNDELRELVDNTAMPQVKTFKVTLEGDPKYTAQVQLLLPPGLREEEITTYPMVVHA